jgi:hypothetical protein
MTYMPVGRRRGKWWNNKRGERKENQQVDLKTNRNQIRRKRIIDNGRHMCT